MNNNISTNTGRELKWQEIEMHALQGNNKESIAKLEEALNSGVIRLSNDKFDTFIPSNRKNRKYARFRAYGVLLQCDRLFREKKMRLHIKSMS